MGIFGTTLKFNASLGLPEDPSLGSIHWREEISQAPHLIHKHYAVVKYFYITVYLGSL